MLIMAVSVIKATDTSTNEELDITIVDKVLIAKGGWATVYRATLVPSGETIAIKQVRETKQYEVRTYSPWLC
jgi:hypothetical protein